jgi:hypothetical protein
MRPRTRKACWTAILTRFMAATLALDVAGKSRAEAQDRRRSAAGRLNDFAQGVRENYVGMNNLKVGRIAASMMATAVHVPGKLAVFVGGYRWHGHELRETGFRSFIRELAPAFTILETRVNLETRQLTYEATLDLLQRHPDLRGIYLAGGGMEGAIAALREVRAPGEVALIVNELTPESRAALQDRYVVMVISTPLAALCRDLMGLMRDAVRQVRASGRGAHREGSCKGSDGEPGGEAGRGVGCDGPGGAGDCRISMAATCGASTRLRRPRISTRW